MTRDPKSTPPEPRGGLAPGGRGGPEDQLLEDGQEEVFSRAEVELGRIEHQARAGESEEGRPFGRPSR